MHSLLTNEAVEDYKLWHYCIRTISHGRDEGSPGQGSNFHIVVKKACTQYFFSGESIVAVSAY